jgi:L-histidine N-alpha-methyltransferase
MTVAERISIANCLDRAFHEEMKRDVLAGLSAQQKSIPCKYFYDARGSRIFNAICRLPEYYQTRTELSILKKYAAAIIGDFDGGDIVELGSGENLKIRTLLDAAYKSDLSDVRYVPVDVSESALVESATELISCYPGLKVSGIVADFTRHMRHIGSDRKKLLLFFGSTIGNFSDAERSAFLRSVAGLMGPDDRFVLGIDMLKPVPVLEAAYNDAKGVTAEFNRNILNVLNRELGADFDPARFDHIAFYNGEKEQVEMHLRTDSDVVTEISDLGSSFPLRAGETIQTEICRKFSRSSAAMMAEDAGLKIESWFSDPQEWFSVIVMATTHR